jgi:crossover junction endodeoxyribonuclease RuvC
MAIYLGIDPGFGRVGWGAIELGRSTGYNPVCRGYGCITTPPNAPLPDRLHKIELDLLDVINELSNGTPPVVAGVEKLFFGRNITTAMNVAAARGVILLTLHKSGIPISEPTPKQVKQVVGWGSADKQQVQQVIQTILNLPEKPKPDDAADALAVALYAEAEYRTGLQRVTLQVGQ